METHQRLDVKYNTRTGKVKRLKLEKLSKPVSDFVKHLNFVFSGTLYGIKSVSEYRDVTEDQKSFLQVEVILYKLKQKPEKKCSDGPGYIGVTVGGYCEKPRMSILYYEPKNKHAVNVKKLEKLVRDYDLSRIF